MLAYRYIDVRKYVWVRNDPKLILGLAIIVAGVLAGYYVNALWLNIIMLAAVAVIVLNFGLLGSTYDAEIRGVVDGQIASALSEYEHPL